MLTKCPECELQVSDKALICPHCGYPISPESKKIRNNNSNKHKRLPNGFGQISEIKNKNLRNRFRAMVTVGKNSKGRPIVKPLKPQSYFSTYNEAYTALVEYNKNPYDISTDSITIKELYDKWTSEYFKSLKSKSSERNIISAWNYCSELYDMRAKDLRGRHIKNCMNKQFAIINGEKKIISANMQSRIKSLFNLMYDYALEYEIVDVNYARTFNISEDIQDEIEEMKRSHIVFTDEEIELLWKNINEISYIDVLLIQCYGGWRPQELGLIKLENVDFDKNIIIGGIKTKAGKNRIVPIHSKIKGIIKKKYDEATALGSEYLINCTDGTTHKSNVKMTYDKYRKRFCEIRDSLNMNPQHRAHDGRMHFITKAKKYNVDEYAIKYIVGHAINDVTEKVYTEREINWLIEEIEKIK